MALTKLCRSASATVGLLTALSVAVALAPAVSATAQPASAPLAATPRTTKPASTGNGPLQEFLLRHPRASQPRFANPSQPLTFYWGLRRDDSGAAAAARRAADPHSPGYRRFMTSGQVARRFGASNATVAGVSRYLRTKGLAGRVDRSRVFMRVSGTAATFEAAFAEPIESVVLDAFTVYGPAEIPILPPRIARLVPQTIWESQTQITGGRSMARRTRRGAGRRATFPENLGTMRACSQLTSQFFASILMTPAQAATAYEMKRLRTRTTTQSRGDIVVRPPIAVLALGSGFSDDLLAQATRCYGVGGSARRVETDGMNGPLPSAAGEGDLDVQMVLAGLAGNSRIPVFEASSDDTAILLASASALDSLAVPQVLTISYGSCEPNMRSSERALDDAVFMRLGLVGTSVLASAGDSGSSDCVDQNTGEGPRQRSVDYPASSPWVTGVGGTRIVLTRANKRAAEYAWNDQPWGEDIAGGGGTSMLYGRPAWQPRKITGSSRRTVPDISAHASDFPGFPLVGLGQPTYFAEPIAGTSAAAPLTAAGIALLSRQETRAGRPPLGWLNPWLYQLPRAALFDIVHGNNDLYGQGCCTAKKGYDEVTGRGSPNFATMRRSVRPAG